MLHLTMYPLDLTLQSVLRALPPTLASPEARARLAAAASRLPAELASRLFLECRLEAGDAQVDLTLAVEDGGREILAGRNPALALPAELRGLDAWERVGALCRAWSKPGSPLAQAVGRVWLEFDLPEGSPTQPEPGVFVEFTRQAFRRPGATERWRTALAVLEPLLGGPVPQDTAAALLRCFRRLPAGAWVPYVGVLLPRGTEAVRLCIAGLGDARTPAYLAEAGWPGALSAVADELRLARIARPGAAVPGAGLVDLDVGGEVLPTLGLEYVFTRPDQLRGTVRETGYLDWLVARGLCAAEKRDGLLAWPGCAVEQLPHHLWRSLASRRVAHVKLVLDGARVRQAKGYLSVSHAPWLRAARGTALPGRGTVPPRARADEPATRQLVGS